MQNAHLKRGESRPWLTPLILGLLCIIFFRHVQLPEQGYNALTGADLTDLNYPRLTFVVQAILGGQFPLWNPYQYGGIPAIANPQLGLFYLPNWLMLLTGAVRGATLLIVLHVWWGAWGMAKLARSLGASVAGGLLAGIIFGFSQFFMANLWAGHYARILVIAWGPWAAAAYRHALQRGTLRAALPGAIALTFTLLGGHLAMALYVVLLLGGLWVYHIVEAFSDGEPVRPALWLATRQLAIMGIGALLLGAVQLLPTLEFLPLSTRTTEAGLEYLDSFALPGAQLLTLLVPNLLGNPNLPEWGYWGSVGYEELSSYAGLWAAFAALLALRLRQRETHFYWAVALVGLIMSLGTSGGLVGILYQWAPQFVGMFRAQSRSLYLVVIALAGLGGLVLTYLQSASADERRAFVRPALRLWLPVAAILVFGGVLVLLALWSLSPPDAPYWRLWHMANALGATGLMLLGVGIALWLWREDGPHATGWATLVTVVVVVIDLWRVGLPLVTVDMVEPAHWLWNEIRAALPAPDPSYRVMTSQEPYWETIAGNGAMVTGYFGVNGLDATELDSYLQFRDLSGDPTAPNNRLWGVRYFTLPGTLEEAGFDEDIAATLLAEGNHDIYEVEGGLRVFVPAAYEVRPDDEDARQRLMSDGFDPARTVILDREPGCPVSGEGGSATFGEYALNHVAVNVDASGPGLLVLTDQWYPGWTVSVDGQPQEVLRAYTIFRAVCVPEGQHDVTFRFRPLSFRLGAVISLAAWASLALFALMPFLRRAARVRGETHAEPLVEDET